MQDRYYSAFNLDFGNNDSDRLFNLDSVRNTLQIRKDYYTNIDTLLTIYFTAIIDELSDRVMSVAQTKVNWKGVDINGKYIIFTGISTIPTGSYVQTEHGTVIVTPELAEKMERLFTVTLPIDEVAMLKTQEDVKILIAKYIIDSSKVEKLQDFNYNELTNAQLESLKSNIMVLQSEGKLGIKC